MGFNPLRSISVIHEWRSKCGNTRFFLPVRRDASFATWNTPFGASGSYSLLGPRRNDTKMRSVYLSVGSPSMKHSNLRKGCGGNGTSQRRCIFPRTRRCAWRPERTMFPAQSRVNSSRRSPQSPKSCVPTSGVRARELKRYPPKTTFIASIARCGSDTTR